MLDFDFGEVWHIGRALSIKDAQRQLSEGNYDAVVLIDPVRGPCLVAEQTAILQYPVLGKHFTLGKLLAHDNLRIKPFNMDIDPVLDRLAELSKNPDIPIVFS